MRLEKVLFEGVRFQANAGPILREVIAQLVPLRNEGSRQVFLASQAIRDQEERCGRLVPPQLRQNQGRRNGVGAVVNRQCHEPLLGRHLVQASRIPPSEPLDQPIGGRPDKASYRQQPAGHHNTDRPSSPHTRVRQSA
jgi:hypothetical protein